MALLASVQDVQELFGQLEFKKLKPVSIKYGLRTTDCGLGIKYGLGIKRGLGIRRGLQAVDWV